MTPTPTDYANAADLAAMAAEIGFGPKDADKLRNHVVADEEIAGFLALVSGIRRAALEEAANAGGKFLMKNTGLAVEYVVELEAAIRALREQALIEGK